MTVFVKGGGPEPQAIACTDSIDIEIGGMHIQAMHLDNDNDFDFDSNARN